MDIHTIAAFLVGCTRAEIADAKLDANGYLLAVNITGHKYRFPPLLVEQADKHLGLAPPASGAPYSTTPAQPSVAPP